MSKTPDEIKKGLECCGTGKYGNHKDCPYDIAEPQCMQRLLADTLALIQQLQAQNAEKAERIRELETEVEKYEQHAEKCCYESRCNAEINTLEALGKRLMSENERLEAERDALIKEIETFQHPCDCCKHAEKEASKKPCDHCKQIFKGRKSQFEWRGVQKE